MINKLVIIGVGLIGGSLALALREAGAVKEIVGLGRSRENLEAARTLGIIDRIETDLASAVKDADVVVLAVPVAAMQPTMAQLSASPVAAHHRHRCRQHQARCHRLRPTASAEPSGPFRPRAPHRRRRKERRHCGLADLFQGRNVVRHAAAENDAQAVSTIAAMWQTCGAMVNTMPPAKHDEIFAAVSHLPHLLAFALVEDIAFRANARNCSAMPPAASATSPASPAAHPEMWRDICLANRDALIRGSSMPTSRSSTACAPCWSRTTALRWSRCLAMPAPPAPNGWPANRIHNRHIPWNFSIFRPIAQVSGTVVLPGSKSISNRTLLLAALAEGVTEVKALLASDDTGHMLEALRKLGVKWQQHGDSRDYRVEGVGGAFPVKQGDLFLGNAGTAFRPLTAALALSQGDIPAQRRGAHARAPHRRPGGCPAPARRRHHLSRQ